MKKKLMEYHIKGEFKRKSATTELTAIESTSQ